jgi:hypothetical protein
MTVLLPHGAFLREDRRKFTQETAEPLGVSPPEAVDLLLIKIPIAFCVFASPSFFLGDLGG